MVKKIKKHSTVQRVSQQLFDCKQTSIAENHLRFQRYNPVSPVTAYITIQLIPYTVQEGSLQCSQKPVAAPYLQSVKSSPHPVSFKINVTVSFHLSLRLPNLIFPPSFPPQKVQALHIMSMHSYMSRPRLLHLITILCS